MKLKLPTKLPPAPLGQGGHLAKMARGISTEKTLAQAALDARHALEQHKLKKQFASKGSAKSTAPKLQGTGK
jgi:hypothetical protein